MCDIFDDGLGKHPKAKKRCPLCSGGGILDDGENWGAIFVACPCTGEAEKSVIEKIRKDRPDKLRKALSLVRKPRKKKPKDEDVIADEIGKLPAIKDKKQALTEIQKIAADKRGHLLLSDHCHWLELKLKAIGILARRGLKV